MSRSAINRERIDELLRFLPLFDRPPQPDFEEWWGLGERDEDDGLLPFDGYPPEVQEFLGLIRQECWVRTPWDPEEADALLGDEEYIGAAGLDEMRVLLTGIGGCDYIWEGHAGSLLASGVVARTGS